MHAPSRPLALALFLAAGFTAATVLGTRTPGTPSSALVPDPREGASTAEASTTELGVRIPQGGTPVGQRAVADSNPTVEPAAPIPSGARATSRTASELVGADADTLRALVLASPDPAEVHAAVWAMANRLQLADADVDALLERLDALAPEDEGPRRAIAWALSLRPDRVPVDRFGRLAIDDPSAEVRRSALRTLGSVESAEALTVLEHGAFEDADARNRGESITLLGFDAAASDALGRAWRGLEQERDPEVRARWLGYVGAQRPEGFVDFLAGFEHAEQEDERVRRTAAELLAAARQG